MSLQASIVSALYEQHRSYLWGLGYRMSGTAEDADDLLQETFVRLLEKAPPDTEAPLLPWLVRVLMNLARDALRRRKTRDYTGPWLPGPVPDTRLEILGLAPEARYELKESVTLAFLQALEALTEDQRAVLVLRDVFAYSVAEAAAALELSEANVKTIHLRARRAMEAYDRARRPPTPERVAATEVALQAFFAALQAGDAEALLALLAEGVEAVADGGGEFVAGQRPVLGREKVARLFQSLAEGRDPEARVEVRLLNGLPTLVSDGRPPREGYAGRAVVQVELNEAGQITRIRTVVASAKLGAVWGPAGLA